MRVSSGSSNAVMAYLPIGSLLNPVDVLRGVPLARHPAPQHHAPHHAGWRPWCALCMGLKAYVEGIAAEYARPRRRFP